MADTATAMVIACINFPDAREAVRAFDDKAGPYWRAHSGKVGNWVPLEYAKLFHGVTQARSKCIDIRRQSRNRRGIQPVLEIQAVTLSIGTT